MATDSVTANSRNRRPTMPPMRRIGINTATRERLMEMTVKAISRDPRRAACSGAIPFSTYRVIFSRTTIASSTTKPVAIVRAMRERLSRLYPQRYMTPKVPIERCPTATAGMTVERTCLRNPKTTRITSAAEIMSDFSTSLRDPRIGGVRSCTTETLTLPGKAAASWGSRSRTRSTVPMMFAPGCRKMITMTDGFPFTSPAVRTSSTEFTTSATS